MKRRYNLSVDRFDAMKQKQNGKCALPFCHVVLTNQNTHVDHCHRSGKVRGLLCLNCNMALGKLGDRVDTLLSTALYLSRGTETLSPTQLKHITSDMAALNEWFAALQTQPATPK